MSRLSPRAMRPVLILLKTLIVLNIVICFVFLLLLAASFSRFIASTIAEDFPTANRDTMVASFRVVMLIGICMTPFAHVLLTRLKAIVQTVQAGDPFVPINAGRLTIIAWSLLAIQLLDLGFGFVALSVDPAFQWSFSLTGWLAVVLLFVLAKVFEQGTAMRDDLAGTV